MGNRLLQASLLLVTLPVAGTAFSDAANDPDYTITGNATITSDYMFRGISQTWGNPAIQGGSDLALKNGGFLTAIDP